MRALAPALALLALLALLRAGLGWAQEVLAQNASADVRTAVRDHLLRHVLARGPRLLHGERTGEIANTLTSGVEALDAYVAQYLPALGARRDRPGARARRRRLGRPALGARPALTFPLVPLFLWLIGSAAQERTRAQWVLLSRLSARFLDALSGLPTLRAFGRAADEARALEAAGERHRRVTMEVLRLAFVSALVLEALATLGTAVVAVEVGLRLLYGRLEFAPALACPRPRAGVLPAAARVRGRVPRRDDRARGGRAHGRPPRRDGTLRRPRSRSRLRPRAAAPRPTAPHRRSFPLSPVRTAGDPLRGRHLHVRARPSAGPRRLHPRRPGRRDGGARRADGGGEDDGRLAPLALPRAHDRAGCSPTACPSARSAPEEWRRHVAWVPQRPRLFHGTLRENLLLARPDATDDEIRRAIRLARIEGLVAELPCGLDTPLGADGARLSGGEAQRLALARAFLKDAPVLVLDEPTAQLDAATEADVLESIRELRQGRTVVLVAHRLATAASADRIAVVAAGRVVEEGTPRRAREPARPSTAGWSRPPGTRRERRPRPPRLRSPAAPACPRLGGARRAHDRLRRRPHGHLGVAARAGGTAPVDRGPAGRDRRRPRVRHRPGDAALPRASRVARRHAAPARGRARRPLPTARAAGAGAPRRRPRGGRARPGGGRHRDARGISRARPRPEPRRPGDGSARGGIPLSLRRRPRGGRDGRSPSRRGGGPRPRDPVGGGRGPKVGRPARRARRRRHRRGTGNR